MSRSKGVAQIQLTPGVINAGHSILILVVGSQVGHIELGRIARTHTIEHLYKIGTHLTL